MTRPTRPTTATSTTAASTSRPAPTRPAGGPARGNRWARDRRARGADGRRRLRRPSGAHHARRCSIYNADEAVRTEGRASATSGSASRARSSDEPRRDGRRRRLHGRLQRRSGSWSATPASGPSCSRTGIPVVLEGHWDGRQAGVRQRPHPRQARRELQEGEPRTAWRVRQRRERRPRNRRGRPRPRRRARAASSRSRIGLVRQAAGACSRWARTYAVLVLGRPSSSCSPRWSGR